GLSRLCGIARLCVRDSRLSYMGNTMRKLMPAVLVLAVLAQGRAQNKQSKPTYEVYAISYGVIPDFPVSGLVAGADRSRKLDIQMMVWLLKGSNGSNILVDSGFYRDKFFTQWKVKNF